MQRTERRMVTRRKGEEESCGPEDGVAAKAEL